MECDHFDNSTNVAPPTVHNSTQNATKDEEILVHTLHFKCKVFQWKGFHSTPKFQKVSRYNFSRINKPKLKEWFKKHIRKMKVREDYRKKLQQPLPTCQLQSTQRTHPISANWSTEIFSFDSDSSAYYYYINLKHKLNSSIHIVHYSKLYNQSNS